MPGLLRSLWNETNRLTSNLEEEGRLQREEIVRRANANRLKQIPWAVKNKLPDPVNTVYFPAKRAGLDPRFVDAVTQTETGYRPRTSSAGAVGHMQVMPKTAAGLGFKGTPEQLAEPANNFNYGTKYIANIQKLRGKLTPLEMYHRYVHGASTTTPVQPNMPYAQNFQRYYGR